MPLPHLPWGRRGRRARVGGGRGGQRAAGGGAAPSGGAVGRRVRAARLGRCLGAPGTRLQGPVGRFPAASPGGRRFVVRPGVTARRKRSPASAPPDGAVRPTDRGPRVSRGSRSPSRLRPRPLLATARVVGAARRPPKRERRRPATLPHQQGEERGRISAKRVRDVADSPGEAREPAAGVGGRRGRSTSFLGEVRASTPRREDANESPGSSGPTGEPAEPPNKRRRRPVGLDGRASPTALVGEASERIERPGLTKGATGRPNRGVHEEGGSEEEAGSNEMLGRLRIVQCNHA